MNEREFLGFALTDPYAPLIFVNGAVSRSCQIFPLAHELADLWLGEDAEGLSGFDLVQPGNHVVERFCDIAAPNFLVPGNVLSDAWLRESELEPQCFELASRFKVRPIVIARRAKDLELISDAQYLRFFGSYFQQEPKTKGKKTAEGGFYNIQ